MSPEFSECTKFTCLYKPPHLQFILHFFSMANRNRHWRICRYLQ